MKYLIGLIVTIVLLTGCTREVSEVTEDPNSEFFEVSQIYPFSLLTDRKTGCQYITMSDGGKAITPRMDADGKQICKPLEGRN